MIDRKNDTIMLYDGVELAYGENRDQSPAFLFATKNDDPLAPSRFKWVSGIPSYISMADGMQITDILCLLAESFRRWNGTVPYITIAGKHGSPCGAAISYTSSIETIHKALACDTLAIMGGEVVTNFPINQAEAEALFVPTIEIGRDKWGLDILLAPEFSEEAVSLLGKWEKRRLLSNPALAKAPFPEHFWVYRQVRSEWLRQMAPKFVLTHQDFLFWTGKRLDIKAFEDLLIAFACCWRAPSNTVTLAKDGMLIGSGCGQQDRIACVRLCLERANRAGHDTRGSVFASDAFFPFAYKDFGWSETEKDDYVRLMDASKITIKSCKFNKAIKEMAEVAAMISRMDKREGPQLLVDAGCIGGVVPADGIHLEEVSQFFRDNGLSVGFIPKEHRGFSKH